MDKGLDEVEREERCDWKMWHKERMAEEGGPDEEIEPPPESPSPQPPKELEAHVSLVDMQGGGARYFAQGTFGTKCW